MGTLKSSEFTLPDFMSNVRITTGYCLLFSSLLPSVDMTINEGDTLTLDKIIQIAQNYEYSQEQSRTMDTSTIPPGLAEVRAPKSRQHRPPVERSRQSHIWHHVIRWMTGVILFNREDSLASTERHCSVRHIWLKNGSDESWGDNSKVYNMDYNPEHVT